MRPLEADPVAFEAEAWRSAQPAYGSLEPVAVAFEDATDAASDRFARAVELAGELIEVGDDELAGGGGSRSTYVGCEVAERCVLLVTDRGNDRDAARRDGAD